MRSMINKIAVLLIAITVGGCGGGDAFTQSATTGTGGGTIGSAAASLSLGTTQTSVKSDNSNSATITATVLDANNGAVSGTTVTFSASGGQLSASSVKTDASGMAKVMFSSGTADPSNRTATVNATVSGVAPAQIPIAVTGSTLTISPITAPIIGGTNPETVTISAKNASGTGVYNTPITLSVAGSGTSPGTATVTPASATADINGQVTATLTGTSPGTVTVTATGLGITASQNVTVSQQGAAFAITSPSNPAVLATGSPLTVTVSAPTQANLTFVSTLGTWNGGTTSLVTTAVSGGVASATLTSTTGGTATVEVFDAANPSTYATLTVLITAPASQAGQIALQSSVSVVAPSVGSTLSQATFTATVRTSVASGGAIVAGAPVAFTLTNTTGGGEYISPVYGLTDQNGKVTTTFTAGSLSSSSTGVTVTATVYGAASTPIASASKNIIINQTPGSVVIGAGTTITEPVSGGASYQLPMSVVVADSNGNPVQATVSLSAWPAHYNTGYWLNVSNSCSPVVTGVWDNEDLNRNLILDPGEDMPYIIPGGSSQGFTISDTATKDGNGQEIYQATSANTYGIGGPSPSPVLFITDGVLTPANSAAGTLPATVQTDANGVANFNLTYLKQDSVWITDEIKATVVVSGTETTGILPLPLPYVATDGQKCQLYDSPFNPKAPAP